VGLALSVLVVAGAVTAAVVRRDGGEEGPTLSRIATDRPCEDTGPTPAVPQLPAGTVALNRIGDAEEPTTAVFAPGGSGDGFLGERAGRVRRISAGRLTDDVVLDLRADTMPDGDGGLLGLAYGPDADWLYVYRADAARDDVVTAHPLGADGLPDPEAGRVILTVDHPDSLQHHGGALVVGTDGLLYVGLGDGGGLGDPRENAEDRSTHLGKVLRIDPTPDAPEPYRIPPDNPFVEDSDAAPEIWVLGVRNPFRMGLDGDTGDLWLGDVGQSCWEEIDHLPTGADSAGGANLGWDHLEGTHEFEGGEVPGRSLAPIQEHPHADGWCGIVAGYVPRGSSVPGLDGRLLYTDYCKGKVLALAVDGTGALDPGEARLVDTGLRVENPLAIVPGPGGEPWVLSLGGDIWAIAAAR